MLPIKQQVKQYQLKIGHSKLFCDTVSEITFNNFNCFANDLIRSIVIEGCITKETITESALKKNACSNVSIDNISKESKKKRNLKYF